MRFPVSLKYAFAPFGLVCLFFWAGCEPLERIEETQEVEVAPGKWLTVRRVDWCYPDELSAGESLPQERTRLTMSWNKQELTWEGVDIPITLREWEGRLYIIGYDRETDPDKPTLRYYRQSGNGFQEIKPQDFPKRIATQNMWLINPKMADDDPDRYEKVDLARQIDPGDPEFAWTLTAKIWAHLSTGSDDYVARARVDDPTILKEFKEKYQPIPLPAIVKTDCASPAKNGGTER